MAPALTKVLKDGHGIHLSSPPSSVRVDSNGRAVCSAEPEPHLRSMGDGDCQKMWLNLSMFPSLESCLPVGPLDLPASPLLSPCLQASAGQCEAVPLPSPASLLSFLSFHKSLNDSHQVVPILPGVPDMFLGPVPEHNSQEACLLHGCSAAAAECGPDGGDVHRSPFTLTSVSPSDSLGRIKFPGHTPFFAAPPSLIQEKADGVGCSLPESVPSCGGRVNFDLRASRAVLEDAVKEQLVKQAALHGRAWTLQKRLQALLGEHAVLHCHQQLEGLKRHCQLGDVSHDSLDFTYLDVLPPQACGEPLFESSTASSSFTELRQFSQCSQEVLRSLQEALDSEATASSSSDDDFEEEEKNHGKTKTSHGSRSSSSSSSCETRWLEERAELGSRWSWLQLRVAELEGRIQPLVQLHKHIRSSKGGVVLAESQPLTDRQIQQTLLREMAGLSCTASDADTEPCSPTHLLYSIERQSAQLSQIVNSLMPPLFSPLSKQAQNCKVKRTLKSGQRGDGVFMPGSSKRRRLATTSLFKADVSCVCARTRPLVTYQKPRLFTLNTNNPSSPPESGKSTSTLTSSVVSSSCSCFSSCDCSSASEASTKKHSSTPHPVLFPSFDTPRSHYLKRAQAREEWSQRPLVINAPSPTPSHCNRRSSTPLHNSQKYKQHARHRKSRVMGLSPIRMSGSAQSQHRRANQRKRKRRCVHRLIEDDLCQLSQLEESSDEVLEESYTQVSRKQASQGSVRKRQGESVYNINNIVIPLSLAKVEKLQYKDILTPRWRAVSTLSLVDSEAEKVEDTDEGQVEDLSEETFAQRHLASEQREKLRWSSWGERKCVRRPTRSGSRLSGGGGGMCTSGEESSVEWSGAQLDTDEQPSSEEWLPEAPWEPRVFPLGEDDEDALLGDILQDIPSEWLETGVASSSSSSSKNSNSHLSPPHSSGTTLPSGAHSRNTSPNSS